MSGRRAFGIDIGGSGMKAAPVDLETGELTEERFKILTPKPSNPEKMADVVAELVGHFSWTGPIGVTFPGVVRHGVVYTAANLDKSWIGTDADALFTKAAGAEVHVVNDADAAGLAEVRYGAGRDRKGVVLVLTFGTGIGSGLFMDGVLVPNSELGHLEIDGHDAESKAAASARDREGLSWKEWAVAGPALPGGRRRAALTGAGHRRRRRQPQGREVAAAHRGRHRDRPRRPGERGRHRRRRAGRIQRPAPRPDASAEGAGDDEVGDAVVVVAEEPAQHVVVVLAHARPGPAHHAGRP